MLTPQQCRKIDPTLKDIPDEELVKIAGDLTALAQLAFEVWLEKRVSKYPGGVLQRFQKDNKLQPWKNQD